MRVFICLVLSLLASASVASAEELVLTTYYPAPNGQYLNMNVAGTLTGAAISMTGAISGLSLTASGANPSITLFRNAVLQFSVNNGGSITTNGAISANGAISTGGSIVASGKMYSQQTQSNDPDNTVVTKGYVLSRANIQIVAATCSAGYPQYCTGVCDVTCPAGTRVVSGGGDCTGAFGNGYVNAIGSSGPISASAWRIVCTNFSGVFGTMSTYAVCM